MSVGISIGDVLKLCELAGRVYKNCRDCSGEYKSLTSEARSLSNLLEDIQDKYDKIPENKRQQLVAAYEPCIEVLQELDKLLLHYNSLDTKSKRAWDRLKWDPEKSRTLRDRLVSTVAMLNTFYTSLIHDSQVLILEALERLERDYQGGHREESIASIERITSGSTQDNDEDDDEAWTSILRDLEDVGVSQQEALSYRNVIVDWLVTAVNEGRLLEKRPEQHSFASMSQDLWTSLPSQDPRERQHSLNVLATLPPVQRSLSAPFPHPLPVSSPPGEIDYLTASPASLPVHGRSSTSLYTTSRSSDSDASSLYARPQPPPTTGPSAGSRTYEVKRVPVPFSSAQVQAIPGPPLLAASHLPTVALSAPSAPSGPPAFAAVPVPVAPSAYYDEGMSTTADLEWTAQQIVAAWSRRDFNVAERHLEEQLAAVERGQTGFSGTQPDRRILRYLIGVCASFTGRFDKAKRFFESVFNGIYLDRRNLDDGDIAACRWLGDVCLHLREHHNAVLAYSVAYEGSIGRYGVARDRTQRVAAELRLLDHWLFVFRRIEYSFDLNVDPTDIFASTHATEKSNLIISVKARLYERNGFGDDLPMPSSHQWMIPSFTIGVRPRTELMVSEGFVLGPLISPSNWPLPWDSTFSPTDAVKLDRYMNTVRVAKVIRPLVERELPVNRLGDSKNLHYVTKRGSQWLIEAVKSGLQDIGIEHAEHGFDASIVCCLNQHRNGFAFSEGLEICFRKLQFRNLYGIKITTVKWATRRFAATNLHDAAQFVGDTTDFRDIVKGILERAEFEAANPKPKHNIPLESTSMYLQSGNRPYIAELHE